MAGLSLVSTATPTAQRSLGCLASARVTAVRAKSFKMFLDETDAEVTLRHAREVKKRAVDLGDIGSAKYLNSLIAIAVAHFQRREYALARRCALFAHTTIVEAKGPRSTLVYFSATTCANCSRALARELTKVADERREIGNAVGVDDDVNTSTLASRDADSSFESVDAFVAFLRQEVRRFDSIAQRMLVAPDKYFMRTDAQHREAAAREDGQRSSDFEAMSSPDAAGAARRQRAQSEARKRGHDAELRRARVAAAEQAYAGAAHARSRYAPPKSRVETARHKGMPITTTLRVVR